MVTALVGFFLEIPAAGDAIARLKAAGYHTRAGDGEQFDSKWQQGRIAVVVTAPNREIDPGQEAEVRTLLLQAGALDIQEAVHGGALPEGSWAMGDSSVRGTNL